MSACPSQTFSNVTPEQFAGIEQKAQKSGVPITGNCGSASTFGGHFTWNYDPATRELTIKVTEPPFLMNCESVNAKISSLVANALA
ncbi:MAG: hypothetical protein ABR976_04125 [Terracidiphilus sp.]|jgi:hypothetical protein